MYATDKKNLLHSGLSVKTLFLLCVNSYNNLRNSACVDGFFAIFHDTGATRVSAWENGVRYHLILSVTWPWFCQHLHISIDLRLLSCYIYYFSHSCQSPDTTPTTVCCQSEINFYFSVTICFYACILTITVLNNWCRKWQESPRKREAQRI